MLSLSNFLAPITVLAESDKRLFYVYLLTSFALGMVVLYKKEKSIIKSFKSFFNLKVLNHRSSRLDVSLFVFNTFLKIFLFSFVTFSSLMVSQFVTPFLYKSFPHFQPWQLSYAQVMILYTVFSFVLLDFSRFFQHYLFHKIPFLWEFHKIHHTAEVLTPMTLFRTHPLESVVASFRRILVLGTAAAFFTFATQSMIGVYAILGVNAFDFVFNFFGSNLRHSHIWLSFGPLNYIFISPAQHQVHHSRDRKYFDTNFGIVLSIWDQLFGTFYSPKQKEYIIFGVRGEKHESFKEALVQPFLSLKPKKLSLKKNESLIPQINLYNKSLKIRP